VNYPCLSIPSTYVLQAGSWRLYLGCKDIYYDLKELAGGTLMRYDPLVYCGFGLFALCLVFNFEGCLRFYICDGVASGTDTFPVCLTLGSDSQQIEELWYTSAKMAAAI
jgi:hypothetical protein